MSAKKTKAGVGGFLACLFTAALVLASPTVRAEELVPDLRAALELSPYVEGLELPTATEFLPDGRAVVVEKGGKVWVRLWSGEKVLAGVLPVDTTREKGLLNVIRHPDFEHNRELIFYYSAKERPEKDKHKVSIIRLGDNSRLDLASERVLVSGLRGPDDHEQGGGLAIDSSGRLLIGVGDTGCRAKKLPEPPYTPTNYFATCLTNGNGKILRIGLDGSIPADNPLVNLESVSACGDTCGQDPSKLAPLPPRKDVWVWGLRNPWRFWVDPKTGLTWVADVGDMAYEEIDIIPRAGGLHYGWPFREGAAGHPVSECRKTSPDTGDCVEPAYQCRHDELPGTADPGCKSINGGLIVDDCRWPDDLRGRYFFGDNANGRVWSLQPTPSRDGVVAGSRRDVAQVEGFVVDMDVAKDGGLYLTVMRVPPDSGRVLRLGPRVPHACPDEADTAQAEAEDKRARSARHTASHGKKRRQRAVVITLFALALTVAAIAVVKSLRS